MNRTKCGIPTKVDLFFNGSSISTSSIEDNSGDIILKTFNLPLEFWDEQNVTVRIGNDVGYSKHSNALKIHEATVGKLYPWVVSSILF